jgi:type I restriction enzyme S subunit
MSGLPPGWANVDLKGVSAKVSYGYTASASTSTIGPLFVRITDIQDGAIDWVAVPRCPAPTDDRYDLAPGDIVVARTGATTGKNFLVSALKSRTVFASYLIQIRPDQSLIDGRFLSSFMNSAEYWRQITKSAKGTAQPGVRAVSERIESIRDSRIA